MDILFIAIIVLMVAASLWWILKPILMPQSSAVMHERTDHEILQELQAKRDSIYAAVKDLEMDFESGKISEQDYQQSRLKFLQSVADVLKQIDTISGTTESQLEARIDALLADAAANGSLPASKQAARAGILAESKELPATAESEFRCPECGHGYNPGDAFCAHCGTSLGKTCPACDSVVLPDDKFCPQCGEPLTATEAATS